MKIEIGLIAGKCNGTMSLEVLSNGSSVYKCDALPEGFSTVTVDANIQLGIITSGKGPRDTHVRDGVIVADKYVDIQYISLSSFRLERYHLHHNFFVTYMGNNSVGINLPSDNDLLYWYLEIIEKHEHLKG